MASDPYKMCGGHPEYKDAGRCALCVVSDETLAGMKADKRHADLLARVEQERDAEKQRAERWKALATKAAPAMAFCAGRTDSHSTSVAAGMAWCDEFKDARNDIPPLAAETPRPLPEDGA